MTFQQTIQDNKPVLVDFHATWCGPCQQLTPILKSVKDRIGDKATIIKVDVDQYPATARQFDIQGVPTLILFKNGKSLWRQSGVVPPQTLIAVLEQYA
ncbi:MAG: thioredoxin [Ferruginibacter sp.]